MDALALLCNLHADGPTTLHQLRAAGCDSILDAASRSAADLERILGWRPQVVRRFQREARILAARVDDGILEGTAEDADKSTCSPRPAGFLEGCEGEATSPAPTQELRRVLDAEEPAALHGADLAPDGRLTDEEDFGMEEGNGSEPVPENFLDRPLSTTLCDGLTVELVEQLARAGVRSLGDLVDGDLLEISSSIGIGYTRLGRIHFLVRRHLESLETEMSRRVDVIPPCPPPGDRLEASGPFA